MWIGKLENCTDTIEDINWSNKPVKALGIYFGNNKSECNLLNWSTKLESCEKLLRNWSRRNLTFFGKIKKIKTLVLPKFVYLAQTLIVPQDILNKINTLIFTFLWSGKRETIKRTILIGNKLEGGIEMPDTYNFFKSLKIKWVKTLINKANANCKLLPEYFMKDFGSNFLIFRMNIDNLKKIPNSNKLSPFYKDLIKCWIQVSQENSVKTDTFENIRKQVIWGNKNLTIKNKCLVYQNWIKSNILFVNDILNENGVIKEQYVLTKLVDKSNWISEINKLKSCIPKTWKTILQTENSIKTNVKTELNIFFRLPKGNLINLQDITNKQIYSQLIKAKYTKPYIHTFWDYHLDNHTSWSKIYSFIHSIKDNRVKQFKYKLVNKIVPSKELRYTWKLSSDSLCPICINKIENYSHLFIDCHAVTQLWSKIITAFKEIGLSNNMKTLRNIIIGYKINDQEYHSINKVLSVIGFSIYKAYYASECRSKKINILPVLSCELKNMLTILAEDTNLTSRKTECLLIAILSKIS